MSPSVRSSSPQAKRRVQLHATESEAIDLEAEPPRIALTPRGDIQSANNEASHVLGCSVDESAAVNFFSYVHARNLRRVMWDLAQMVEGGRQQCRWLLRLRAGTDRWRWYRAQARNALRSEGAILVSLHPLATGQTP